INGTLRLTIPAGALSQDTTVTIASVSDTPPSGTPIAANGAAFSVTFSGGATLSQAMTVDMVSNGAPTHPQLGEIATESSGSWTRLSSNFFRTSDNHVIGLTKTPGVFIPVTRTLQAMTGDSVARVQDTFLHETFGNEAFFGGVLGLHTLLNNLTPAQAVAAGVQVDISKVPAPIAAVLTGADLAAKDAALQDPSVTRALLQAGAVVGVKAVYGNPGSDMATS